LIIVLGFLSEDGLIRCERLRRLFFRFLRFRNYFPSFFSCDHTHWSSLKEALVSLAQFHQCSTYSFYARRSRMRKKRLSSQQCHLALLGPTSIKAAHKRLVKLTQGCSTQHRQKTDKTEKTTPAGQLNCKWIKS